MFIEKLPDEKSLGGAVGSEMPPQPAAKISSTILTRIVVSAIKVDLAQASGAGKHTSVLLRRRFDNCELFDDVGGNVDRRISPDDAIAIEIDDEL